MHFRHTAHARRIGRRVPVPAEMRLTRTARLELTAQGALVGLAAGALIAAYRFCLSHAEQALRLITPWLAERGLYIVWFAVLALIMVVVGTLMLREPDTQGSGIPQLSAEVADRIDMSWQRVLPIKFVEGVLLALSGLSLGREGPSVLLGAMSAKAVSRGLKQNRQRERLLATCGAAAGMSAAFHAPLTGILFALEEVHKSFAAPLIISVMAASVVADFSSAIALGANPTIHFISFSQLPLELYATVLVMGVISGVAGAIHNKGMFFVQELFDSITTHVPYARLAIPFALAGVCAFLAPDLMCGGDAIIEHVISARGESIAFLATLLVGKFVFTCICFGSGAPGGTLLPLVVLGSLIGGITGLAASTAAGISASYVSEFCALGIAGLFAAAIQSPVTAIVLVFELTASFDALLAAAVVSIISYVTATMLGTEPFFEHLLARLLGSKAVEDEEPARHEKSLDNFMVGVGSAVEGRLVSDVTWPDGVLVLTLTRADAELVAHGETELKALDEVLVLTDGTPETEEELARLFESRA